MSNWWLISDEDCEIVQKALASPSHADNDWNCPDEWTDCRGCNGQEERQHALMIFDTGLHVTDEVPDDFKDRCPDFSHDDKDPRKCPTCWAEARGEI